MKFFISRQVEYPDNDNVIEIVQGGLEYANPGMMTPRWAHLGEGKEFNDPREAVEAAIKIRDEWTKLLRHNEEVPEIPISFGCTMGFTLPLTRMTDEELHKKAEEVYEKLPKCEECQSILGKETFGHDFSDGHPFCSERCAEKDYLRSLEDD